MAIRFCSTSILDHIVSMSAGGEVFKAGDVPGGHTGFGPGVKFPYTDVTTFEVVFDQPLAISATGLEVQSHSGDAQAGDVVTVGSGPAWCGVAPTTTVAPTTSTTVDPGITSENTTTTAAPATTVAPTTTKAPTTTVAAPATTTTVDPGGPTTTVDPGDTTTTSVFSFAVVNETTTTVGGRPIGDPPADPGGGGQSLQSPQVRTGALARTGADSVGLLLAAGVALLAIGLVLVGIAHVAALTDESGPAGWQWR